MHYKYIYRRARALHGSVANCNLLVMHALTFSSNTFIRNSRAFNLSIVVRMFLESLPMRIDKLIQSPMFQSLQMARFMIHKEC
jgi:hypothetical protein